MFAAGQCVYPNCCFSRINYFTTFIEVIISKNVRDPSKWKQNFFSIDRFVKLLQQNLHTTVAPLLYGGRNRSKNYVEIIAETRITRIGRYNTSNNPNELCTTNRSGHNV